MTILPKITRSVPGHAHMRAEHVPAGNNMNSVAAFPVNATVLIMLFYRSGLNLRAKAVICVLC